MDNQLWSVLRAVKEQLKSYEQEAVFCHIRSDGSIGVNEVLSGPDDDFEILLFSSESISIHRPQAAIFQSLDKLSLKVISNGNLSTSALQFVKTYLPYCLVPIYAQSQKRAITTAHFAQTLDGRIATKSGHSKWIGNEENLRHAHRMRALCDVVLIGTGTLLRDKPRLTVRHVEGPNPTRVILGGPAKGSDYHCLYESCEKQILVIGSGACHLNGHIEYIQMPAREGRIDSGAVLKMLFQRGYHSVYLEGGAITTPNFLKDNAIDILQLHFAPLLFGSGKSAIVLPEIAKVQHAIQFTSFEFQPIGDTMMFVGQIA